MTRHFLDISEVPPGELRAILRMAAEMKAKKTADTPLAGKFLAQIYEKPSTRTRVSFEVAMKKLGGEVITMNAGDMQLGRGETIADTARVLSRFVDIIMLRAMSHQTLLELAAHSRVPVINGLTDLSHPCQIMADILTFEERKGSIEGKRVAWVGDGNNVLNSWIHASRVLGFSLSVACPAELSPKTQGITLATSPEEAVKGADCVVTDTWFSMGAENTESRRKLLSPYQVTEKLMGLAAKDAIFMHCLPAHRGEEVEAAVIDGPASAVWDEAENRMHAQRAVLRWCLIQ